MPDTRARRREPGEGTARRLRPRPPPRAASLSTLGRRRRRREDRRDGGRRTGEAAEGGGGPAGEVSVAVTISGREQEKVK